MEQIWPNRCGLEFLGSLHELGHHGLEYDSPVHFPLAQQSTKDGVADHHRHPSWLFRVEDGNEEFQHPLSPGIFAVSNGKSVFRVCGIPEFSTYKFICPGRKPLPSDAEPIRFSPLPSILSFWPCSDSPFVLVWGSYG